ncbi:MAG: hypothetical protein CMJ59_07670 [Planctomycetaceae bacterium]|nr:hypothetical protein [Planctomycetaceae bacterium]
MATSDTASIVIVGGGAVGCGVAYSLARAGQTDVLVVEQATSLAAATTAQAAGLVGQVRASIERTRLAMWSVETFRTLQESPGAQPAWREVGSLRLALCDRRVEEFRQLQQIADAAGLEVESIDPQRAGAMWPAMNMDQVRAALWCPSDGYLQPADLTMAYAAHARQQGVRFHTRTAVTGIRVARGRVSGVETSRGLIECQTVINAAGAHAFQLAQQVGLELPIIPVRHAYFVTVPAVHLDPELPVVRIPDATLYLRADAGALLCGGWEPEARSHDPRQIALGQPLPGIDPDWDVLGQFGQQLAPHMPAVTDLGIRSVFRGWPTFTPDGRFIIGESSRLPGFVMAGGCNAHGVSGSAGIGRHVVEAMLESQPSPYVVSLSPNRFLESPWDWETACREARQQYQTYYALEH